MKKKTPKLNLLDSSSRFANCIFPLEEKGKGRRRRRKKKGHPGRENRTRTWARKKGLAKGPRSKDRRVIYLHEPNVVHYLFDEERACGKPDSRPPPSVGGLDDPARGAQVRRESEGWNVAQVHEPFSTRIRNLNMPLFRAITLSLRMSKNIFRWNSVILDAPIGRFHVVERKSVRKAPTFGNGSLEGRREEDGQWTGEPLTVREEIRREKRNDLFRIDDESISLID